MRKMRRSKWFTLLAVFTVGVLAATVTAVSAHDSPNDGHIPKDVNYGFELVGRGFQVPAAMLQGLFDLLPPEV